MSMVETITEKLEAALKPESLEVINESHLHAGHAGSPGTGESHFRVKITSADFAGKSRLAMHQAVNKALKDELSGRIHALAIEAKAS
ncbi:MAG: BolA family transcriptional regulator [Rhodomicrobium sp.]|nr:MAG: BolA family transcriptional regulator [Rhodomicrobium sp.]